MTKADLARSIAQKHNLTQKEAVRVVDAILETISEALAEGRKVELRGFGSFTVKKRPGRTARNPKTGDRVYVPPKATPAFKASKALKNLLDEATVPASTVAGAAINEKTEPHDQDFPSER
jgi:nucleoid DNA-binding protein